MMKLVVVVAAAAAASETRKWLKDLPYSRERNRRVSKQILKNEGECVCLLYNT